MIMSAADFRAAFPGEGQLLEFKQGIAEDKIREAVVAFSNTDGGVILLGVANDGTARGVNVDGQVQARLHRIIANVLDPGRYQFYDLVVGDVTIGVITVAKRKDGFAQMPDGRVLVRRAAMNVALMREELSTFLRDRSLTRFEATPTKVPYTDALPGVGPVAGAFGWAGTEQVETRLREIGLVTNARTGPVLTVAGVLYLTDEPQRHLGKCYIDVFRYRDPGDAYDRRTEITGPLNQQVEQATQLVSEELGSDLVVLGTHRHDLPRVPAEVLREAIANAVAHRVYDNARQPVRIDIRPETVTISSPGPLPEPVTVENMRDQNAARNLHVIQVLRRFRLAEDAGRGIDVMEDTMAANLLDPPEFADDGTRVTVTLRTTGAISPRERAWLLEVEQRGALRPIDRVLVVHAARGRSLTNSIARDLLGLDSVDARAALQRLREAGYLVQRGERGGATYTLASGLHPPAGLQLTDGQMRDVVLGLADEGPVTNELVRARLGLDRSRVLALLASLVTDGSLARVGTRRGTRYTKP
jgi:ATP-dependent DNA helicase RecG